MKRKYIKPTFSVVEVSRVTLLSGSNGVYSSYRGSHNSNSSFGYGGVDDDGLIDPD